MTKLVWRNLMRNKRRTLLTVASLAMALLILSLLGALLDAMAVAQGSSTANRVVARNAISLTFSLPEAYQQRLASIDGVAAITSLDWFQGVYKDDRPQNFFPRFGTNPDTVFEVFSEYEIDDEELLAWKQDRSGFVSGAELASAQGWSIGDSIAIKGDIFPIDLELTLRGTFEAPANNSSAERQIFFSRRYVEEALDNPGQLGTIWLLLEDPEDVPRVISQAEEMFANSAAQVRAETEQAYALSFFEMFGNVRFLFGAIGLAIVVSIFLITANTMAMAARERTSEVAVLRTLGFRRPHVFGMVVGESLVVGLLGAAIGAVLASVLLRALGPVFEATGFLFGAFALTPRTLAIAAAIGVGIGLVSGFFPAFSAARLKIVDGLRRV